MLMVLIDNEVEFCISERIYFMQRKKRHEGRQLIFKTTESINGW